MKNLVKKIAIKSLRFLNDKAHKLIDADSPEAKNIDITQLNDLRGNPLPPVQQQNVYSLQSRNDTQSRVATSVSPHDRRLHELNRTHPYYGLVPIGVLDTTFSMLSHNDDNVAKIYFHFGPDSYETLSVAIFGYFAKSSQVTLDIGSYTGLFSILASSMNPAATVVAFEPLENIATRVADNAKINGFSRVAVLNKAVSDVNGSATLVLYGPNTSTTGASIKEKAGISSVGDVTVETIELDSYLDSEAIAPQLIKIDAEKAELNVLQGATKMLTEHAPTIMLEVIGQPALDEIVDFLAQFNYGFGLIDDYDLDVKFFDGTSYDRDDKHRLKRYSNIICYSEKNSNSAKADIDKVISMLNKKL